MPQVELSPSDSDLICRLQAADLDALGLLFERYRDRVYRTALVIVHDSAVAEDILQDCFLKVYMNAARIDTSRPLAPWLYRLIPNPVICVSQGVAEAYFAQREKLGFPGLAQATRAA